MGPIAPQTCSSAYHMACAVQGALDMATKTAEAVMTPLSKASQGGVGKWGLPCGQAGAGEAMTGKPCLTSTALTVPTHPLTHPPTLPLPIKTRSSCCPARR